MKWMIVSTLVLGAASAAGAGYVAIQSAEKEAALEADSTHVVAEAPDSVSQHTESPDSLAASPDTGEVQAASDSVLTDSIPPVTGEGCTGAEAACVEQPDFVLGPPPPDPEAQKQAYRQVARILSNMGDAEMSQLLAHIENDSIFLNANGIHKQ